MSDSLETPWTVARHSPLSMEFSRQEYWSGLPFPPPGDLPHPGIKLAFPALAVGFVSTEIPGKPQGQIPHENIMHLGLYSPGKRQL